ncbi:3-deoxy-D-manno-octulosonic acid transferase [Aliiroseovarius sp. 2305UL8-7]|uniref:3-deoxy-D-manno-octulosonic acid transferase n=1 Tax=Aliiroseovarius conchicola TaxID=3121637 RepID=UPI003528FCF6
MPPIGISLFRGLQNMQGAAGLERRLRRGVADGTEHPTRGAERLCRDMADRPDGFLIWIHLQNLDEIEKIIGLVQHFRSDRSDINVLLTTAIFDGAVLEVDDIIHQYAPYASSALATQFLDHWQPDMVFWMDAKLDIALLPEVFERDVPAIWVDAHLPKEAQSQWRWLPGSLKSILKGFDTILAETERSARELRKFGARSDQVVMFGPLQLQVVAPSCNMAERDGLARALGARPVWLALGVCEVEEAALLAAHKQLVRRSHRLLLIIEPRDEERGDGLAQRLEDEGWGVARRSHDEEPDPECQVYLADQMGEAGLWMHLAPITYAGGSMGIGTELNPLEPAALGSVVLFGPHVNGYRDAYRRLEGAGAARRVSDAKTLKEAVGHLLSPEEAAKMAMAAWDVTTSGAEVSDLLREKLSDVCDAAEIRGPHANA